jgi:hypothetical protein
MKFQFKDIGFYLAFLLFGGTILLMLKEWVKVLVTGLTSW